MSIQKLRVAVLRGGPSPEYDTSLKTGERVLALLREDEGYEPVDIFIDKNGVWHYRGLPVESYKALGHVDVAFNAMHGAFGEDGQVQRLLNSLKVPYTGAESVPAALAMNKHLAKSAYAQHGLLTPEYVLLTQDENYDDTLLRVFRSYLMPVIVKPASAGSSIGVRIAHSLAELKDAVVNAFEHSERVMVEELIRGREAACGIIENFRDEALYALLPVEITKPKGKYVYGGLLQPSSEIHIECPGSFSVAEGKMLGNMAKQAHQALGLRHYSHSNFIITPSGKVYILETDSLPDFVSGAPFSQSLAATGIREKDFIDHALALARK